MVSMAHEMKRPRFKAVEVLDDFKIRAIFINDSVFTIDFKPFFVESPRLGELLGKQTVFEKATIVEGEGWTVEWQDLDIQIGADTLWLDAQAQNATDENTKIFATWRARNGLSLAEAAKALGMTPRTMSAYGTGQRPVPRYIALACKGWEAEKNALV
jgi:DNA-binding XRE family transcriptional regulator